MTLIRTPVTIVLALAFAQVPLAAYTLQDAYKGHDFFDYWTWEIFADPTHGRVNYVDKSTAISGNLSTGVSFNVAWRFVVQISHVSPNARGRDSVRIHSNTAYGDSVIVLDVQHMPAGCGTWPAFWTNSQKGPWPHGGEIDVIEARLITAYTRVIGLALFGEHRDVDPVLAKIEAYWEINSLRVYTEPDFRVSADDE
ncbi:hypothetical protein C0989_005896 [Termitomyces sp. Mn162]|nr:hypothetical protein C0989_005896 [Termitomyces sp. Mn162]